MKNRTSIHLAIPAVILALALTGCATSADSTAGSDSDTTVDIAAALAELQPLIDAPSAFPVDEPLAASAAGKKIAIIDCGTPSCALFADLAQPAAQALGMDASVIQSGMSADGIANAFDTVLSGGFDGAFVSGLPFPLWQAKAAELKEEGVAIVTTGITGMDDSVGASIGGDTQSRRAGAHLAEWVVVNADGAVDSVVYQTPELPFTLVIAESYVKRIAELCADCTARIADIPVAAIGNTAASMVVDDLTAHPETTAAAFAIGEQALGLPQALKTAGITDVATITNGPTPAQLADVQSGAISAALSADWPVMVWTAIDSLARLTTDQPISAGAADDQVVQQILSGDNLSGDLSQGWTGYPDFADRFMALWT